MCHIRKCPTKYDNGQQEVCHQLLDHNPLQSSYDIHGLINYSRLELLDVPHSTDLNSINSTDESTFVIDHENEFSDTNYDNNLSESDNQFSTAVSKVQIRLNNLINNHKASIKLYDDIVQLFNDYISSPNFDQYAKLKTRKSFIKSIESTHQVTQLRPRNMEVWLHNGGRVTVPVFDAKAMILDLLTNPELMNTTNIAEGYNVFTGDVDENNIANKKYVEIHTRDEWLPA